MVHPDVNVVTFDDVTVAIGNTGTTPGDVLTIVCILGHSML